MSGARVAAHGLAKRFARAAALRDLDLELAPGRCLAVLGPNGAGKSTLLRLCAGLARPSAGRIEIDGKPASHPASRARVGYLGHATLLSPSLSVRENLIFAARLYGVPRPRERAEERLASEGLEALADRPVAALSRGQAQRAAIARSLVHDPGLVLLDEPWSGLDRGASERLSARLAELRGRGHTLLVATHGLEAVRSLADAALVLDAGRCTALGPLGVGSSALESALERALAADERAA